MNLEPHTHELVIKRDRAALVGHLIRITYGDTVRHSRRLWGWRQETRLRKKALKVRRLHDDGMESNRGHREMVERVLRAARPIPSPQEVIAHQKEIKAEKKLFGGLSPLHKRPCILCVFINEQAAENPESLVRSAV